MSRRIVAALVVVFACGCGGTPVAPTKATSTAVSTDSKDVKKPKRAKGSNSTTKSSTEAAPIIPAAGTKDGAEKPAATEEKPAEKNSDKTSATEKPVVIPASFSKSVTLSVPDMNCEFACAPKVRKTLESVGGVAGIKTDIENHTVTFLVDPAKFEEAKALTALKDAKYPATVKVADAK